MKRTTRILLGVLGIAALAAVAARVDLNEIAEHLARLGWGALPVLGLSLVWHVCHAMAWRASFSRSVPRPSLLALLRAKLSGEAMAALAPAPQIGAEVAKAWLTRRHVSRDAAISAQLICKTAETVSGILFMFLGVLAALARFPMGNGARLVLAAAALLLAAAAGGVTIGGRANAAGRLLAAGTRIGLPVPGRWHTALDRIGRQAALFYRQGWRRTSLPLLLHLLCWLLGVLEVYWVLRLIGSPASLLACFVFRALLVAVTNVFCFVPFGAGVFEAGHVVLFHLVGIGPSVAASVAVIRRARKSFWMVWGGLLPLIRRAPAR